jgi:hypothetical protein
MEQSPSSEALSQSSQEIVRLLWKQKFHYSVHKSPPLVPILSQTNPVPTFPSYSPNKHSNILPSTPRSSEWSLLFRFSNKNVARISHRSHACYKPRRSHSPWFYHPNKYLVKRTTYEVPHIVQPSAASRPFLPLRSKYSPQRPVLKRPQSMLFI